MFGMENPNVEETRPINLSPETETNQNLEQTQAQRAAQPTIKQVQPETVQPESASESGYTDTTLVAVKAAVANPPPAQPTPEPAADGELEATMPVTLKASVAQPEPPEPPTPPAVPPPASPRNTARPGGRKGLPWFFFPILGFAILIGILVMSGFGGYAAGIGERKNAEKTQVSQVLQEQYQLALQDIQEGQYNRARQRFEYIIKLDPSYPGVTDKLAEVLLEISTTATPTMLPQPTISPTSDGRDSQQQFDQAQQDLAASDWTLALDDLLKLRKADPAFRTVEIDGMIFLALRNSGRDKILQEADLEGGIYDLTLAEKFGPLNFRSPGTAQLEQPVYHRSQLLGYRLGTGRELLLSGGASAAQPARWLWDDCQRTIAVGSIRVWQHIGQQRPVLQSRQSLPGLSGDRAGCQSAIGRRAGSQRLFRGRPAATWRHAKTGQKTQGHSTILICLTKPPTCKWAVSSQNWVGN